jgi:hypothetical protein
VEVVKIQNDDHATEFADEMSLHLAKRRLLALAKFTVRLWEEELCVTRSEVRRRNQSLTSCDVIGRLLATHKDAIPGNDSDWIWGYSVTAADTCMGALRENQT